jgi:hypothetical protein
MLLRASPQLTNWSLHVLQTSLFLGGVSPSDVMYMESLEIKLFKTHRQPDTVVTYVVSQLMRHAPPICQFNAPVLWYLDTPSLQTGMASAGNPRATIN